MALASSLITPRGRPLRYSANDVLWLQRAVEAEGEPRPLVAQTLVNRWAWLTDTRPGLYPTLASLVRAYAVPVNPEWFPDGAKHLQQLAGIKDPEQRTKLIAKATARRDHASTRTTFSGRTELAVRQALTGPITVPAGALHYAASWVERPQLPLLYAGKQGENSIWGERKGQGIGALYAFATMGPTVPHSELMGERPHAVIAFFFLVGGAAFGLSRFRRHRT